MKVDHICQTRFSLKISSITCQATFLISLTWCTKINKTKTEIKTKTNKNDNNTKYFNFSKNSTENRKYKNEYWFKILIKTKNTKNE